ncbi:hypothetical protein LOTGIDRAFT_152760 [Lottia gigantea]|uniref:Uncharacterized protein n=1 Tax=Lottia gigantea TaxID=225164 RepID=V4AKM9_LOTGI|nr:hypothetical protein LOTGIDRAFT_152760 [Lottia gigantea]ESO97672.1 hypothetical protein LOTGIDRAFT_152760 [Lottia gigantea]
MAALFKKALVDCLGPKKVSVVTNKESSVYDCYTLYWLPLDERMWSGELEFRFIENWAEDVEINFTKDFGEGGIDINNNKISKKSTTRTSTVKKSSSRKENWENELYPKGVINCYGSWDGELFSEEFINSFGESWEGDFFTDLFMKSFELL